MIKTLVAILGLMQCTAFATPSTLDVKKQGENDVSQVVQPILDQYCREQCKVIHVETEVDLAISDETAPGFEEQTSKTTLAPASGKVKILMDENLGNQTRQKIVNLLKDHLEVLDFPVQVETKVTKFPQPASSAYKVADLRERVTREIKASLQTLLVQFCPNSCAVGDFDVQTEVVNPEDVDYTSSQDYFQDGPAAIRVKGVKATLMVDQNLPAEEANGIVEMAKLKVGQYKNSSITSQIMKFPKPMEGALAKNGMYGYGAAGMNGRLGDKDATNSNNSNTTKDSRDAHDINNTDSKMNANETNDNRTDSKTDSRLSNSVNSKENNSLSDKKQEKFERYEKIERVENGDAVQQTLEKFRVYGILLSAVILGLLFALVAINFRRAQSSRNADQARADHHPSGNTSSQASNDSGSGSLTSEEKASLIGKRFEADRLFNELTQIYSEQPKVAKHVFTHVLTEEGVETTSQYLEIFGESVVMDLLRDPGLQADLSELMDFYTRNTFDINDDEKMMLLKKLHHRTVTAKMQVHGSRSATLFDFLAEMDAPQINEMIKNESNTVKAIVLTQCDQKKRQAIFAQHDDNAKVKLMTELSRIDHLPKTYIFNVASALRRKKSENPKLNTEALPGTDVLVSFLEKATMETQRTIIHQLMGSAGGDTLNSLKGKLASIETIRFIRDAQLMSVITHVKHDELIQFLMGCSNEVKDAILSKAPQDLAGELTDGLQVAEQVNRESYAVAERKILNRIKVLANNGEINLSEINERMFAEEFGFNNAAPEVTATEIRRVG